MKKLVSLLVDSEKEPELNVMLTTRTVKPSIPSTSVDTPTITVDTPSIRNNNNDVAIVSVANTSVTTKSDSISSSTPSPLSIPSEPNTSSLSVPLSNASVPVISLPVSLSVDDVHTSLPLRTATAPEIFTSDDVILTNSEPSCKRSLFWVTASVQDKNVWTLADTGSCRNLMSNAFWESLPIHDVLTPPGSTVVVAGDGKTLDLLGWATIRFEIAGRALYHEVGIVRDLPLDFLLGGEFMRPHQCNLQYSTVGRNTFTLGDVPCSKCVRNHQILRTYNSPLLHAYKKTPLGKNLLCLLRSNQK